MRAGDRIPKSLPGFTIIELSIVLIVIGVLMMGIFQGKDLFEGAKFQATAMEFNRLKLSILQYREQFGQWPGNHSTAATYFEGAKNGSGNGKISKAEAQQVWEHLYLSGLQPTQTPPSPKMGGYFVVMALKVGDVEENYIVLSGNNIGDAIPLTPTLTPRQALQFKSKFDVPLPTEGEFHILEIEGETNRLKNGTYDIKSKNVNCLLVMPLN